MGRTPKKDGDERKDKIQVLFMGATILFVTVVGVAVTLEEHERKKAEHPDKLGHGPEVAANPSPLVAVPSCGCVQHRYFMPERMTLEAPPIDRSQPWSATIDWNYTRKHTSPFPSVPGAVIAGDMNEVAPAMGLACYSTVFVFVAGDRATAWSFPNVAWQWNAKLPSTLAVDGASAAPLEGTAFTSSCHELAIENADVIVPLANGKVARLGVDDGAVR